MSGGKSHMRTERVDELLLARYLLGNLTEEEQVQVEDRAFADRDYMGALNAVEADLIDDYVSGELAQADRRAFESRFLTSPQRRSKVEFAQALAKVTAEAEPVASRVPQRPTTWLGLLNPIRAWNPAMRFAGALGAVICVAGGSWLVIDNASMRARVLALEAQRHVLELRAQGLKQELGQAQTRAEGLAAQVRNPSMAEGTRTPLVASLMLMPGLSRAESRVEQLTLGAEAQVARIVIQLETRDDYPRFRAELRSRSGRDILSLSALHPRRATTGNSVSMDVPASALGGGEYELALKGLPDGRAAEDVGYYYFRVQKH
jgi:hypothetical protein